MDALARDRLIERADQIDARLSELADADALARHRALALAGIIAPHGVEQRGHPHPGQKYHHGWVPVTDAIVRKTVKLGGTEIGVSVHPDRSRTLDFPDGRSVRLQRHELSGPYKSRGSLRAISYNIVDEQPGEGDAVSRVVDTPSGGARKELLLGVKKVAEAPAVHPNGDPNEDTWDLTPVSLHLPPNDDPSYDELMSSPPVATMRQRDLATLAEMHIPASRVDLGAGGSVDVFRDGGKFTIRPAGSDGVTLDSRGAKALDGAIDDLWNDDGRDLRPATAVVERTVSTKAGDITVRMTGEGERLQISGPGLSLDVDKDHLLDFVSALGDLTDSASAAARALLGDWEERAADDVGEETDDDLEDEEDESDEDEDADLDDETDDEVEVEPVRSAADRDREFRLLAPLESRYRQSDNTGVGGSGSGPAPKQDQSKHPHVASGPKGGQFTSKGGGGSKAAPKAAPKAAGPSSVPQAPATPRTMKPGDSGEDVRYAQYAMSLLGFHVNQNGSYDAQTAAAVKEIQSRLGMKKPNGHLSAAQLHKLQDAVRLSPCVGQSRSFGQDLGETRELGDDIESRHRALVLLGIPVRALPPDDDDTIDDATRSILDALDEWVERQVVDDWDERAHDVSAELRIPGGKGGGRWTANPVGKAISDALEAWGKGKGPDDPFTFDGKPIDREPLRKAAVARGITLKRGASRDDIVHALLGGVRDEVKTQRAERQKRLGSAKFSINGPDGKKIDVAVYTGTSKPDAPVLREVSSANRPGRVITSQDDLAGLEKWANDNGHTDVAEWAKSERARAEAKSALKAPAKKAAKSAPKVDAHQIAADPSLTDRQKRSRLKSAGVAPEEVDRLVPTKTAAKKAAPKAAKAAPKADAPSPVAQLSPADARQAEFDNRLRKVHTELTATSEMTTPYVSLRRLRPLFADMSKAEFDAAIKRFYFDNPDVSLEGEVNQKVMTPADWAAGVKFGGEDHHLLGITKPKQHVSESPGRPNADQPVKKAAKAALPPATPRTERTDNERFGPGGKKALPPSKSASPRAAAVATDPALTDAEKRSRLKALGLTPGQVDALVPPAGGARPKAGSGTAVSGPAALTAGQLDLSGARKVPGVSEAERKAADLYANDAQRINNLIREGRTGSATIRNLDSLLGRSSVGSDVELWRGLRSGDGVFGRDPTGDLTGAEFTEPGYLSTSANSRVAEQFAGSFGDPAPVVMHLVAPAGTNAVTISDWGSGDAVGGQAEVLLQRGLRMRVVADHGVEQHPGIPQGVRRLDVELVPSDARPKGEGGAATLTGAPGRAVGRDISTTVDYASLPPVYDLATNTDPALRDIRQRQGFDGPPTVVSAAEFDAAVKRGEVQETWRALSTTPYSPITPDEMVQQYRSGEFYPGTGINGNGTYVGLRQRDLYIYGPTMMRIGLRKDAKVISADDLDAEMDRYFATAPEQTAQHRRREQDLLAALQRARSPRARANARRDYRAEMYAPDLRSRLLAVQRDPGRFAALRGYDAITISKERSPDHHAEMIILNRTATIVQGE